MQGLKVKFDERSVANLRQNWDNLIKELENKSTINIKFNQETFKNIDAQVNQVNEKLNKIGKINISANTENIDNVVMNQAKSKLKETETILDRIRNKYKNVGEEVNIRTPFKIDANKQELTEYAKAVAGVKAEWTKCTPTVDSAGNKIKEVNVRAKEAGKYWHNYSMILDESTGKIYKVDKGLSDLQNRQLGLAEKMKVAAQSFFVWMNITNLFYQGIHKLKEGIEFTNELNKMQTNIQMITGMDRSKVQGITQDFSDLAGQLHSTTKETMAGAEEFLRAGKSVAETKNLLESATIGGKISGQETKEVSEQLVAISNGFKINVADGKKVMDIVDKLSTVDNNASTSFRELATAMKYTSSTAQSVNVEMPNLISYIGTISSVSRKSAESIGNSMKTIFTRFQSVKEGKKFDPDNEPLSNVEKSLNRVGIAIRKDKDHFKDFDVVLEDIGKKWKSFNDIQKSTIVSSLGGTRQGENLRILFENMEQVHDLQNKMVDSSGSAKQKFDSAYGESTEAKINQLKRSIEQLYMTLINSNAINKFVGYIKSGVDWLNAFGNTSTSTKIKLISLISVMVILIKNFSLFKGLQLVQSFQMIGLSISVLASKILAFVTNPIGALIIALGTVVYAITKQINKQKELQKQISDTASSYRDLTKAIKENNIEGIKSSSKDLKSKTDEYTNAIKKRKELQRQIADMDVEKNKGYFDRKGLFDSTKYSKLQTELKKTNKTIEEQTKILKQSGIAFNENTGEIYALTKAQSHLINNDTAEKLNKEKESAIKHKDELISLIQEYQHLSSVENANAIQKERMSQIARQLGSEMSDLVVVTDADGNATIRNTQLLDGKVQMIEKEKDAIVTKYTVLMENSKNEAIIEMNGTTTTYNEVKKRIKAIEAEINEWNKLLAAKAKANNFNPQANPEDSREASLYMRNKAYKGKQIGDLKNLLSEVDDIYKTYKAPDLPSPSGGASGGGGSGYMPPSGGDDKKKKKAKSDADKRKREAEEAERKRKEALKKALDDAINKYDYAIKIIENKIANARNRMELYTEDGDKAGNRVSLMKDVEKFTNQKIAQLEAKKRFIQNSINSGKYEADTVKDLKSKLLDIDGTLSDVYTSLKKIKMEIIDETYKQKTVEITKELEKLKDKMEEIDSADTFNKQKLNYMDSMIEKLKQQRSVTQSYVNELEKQMRATRDMATRSALEDSIKKYREELQSLQIEIIKSMTDRKNLIKDLTFEIEKIDQFNRVIEETNNNLKKHNFLLADLELQIEMLKESFDISGVSEKYNEYIEAMKQKTIELKNQSSALSQSMTALQAEFKAKFNVDISGMSKKELTDLYQKLFATRVTNSKEEKEALEEQSELFKQLVDDYWQLIDAIQENKEAIGGINNEIIEKQKEQADYILNIQKEMQDKTKEMMLKGKDDEKKILDERLKNFKEFIDKRQKELDKTWKQEDYDRDLQKKKEEEAKLIAEIESKRRVTDLQGQAEVKRLEEELAKLQEDISNFERDHNRDMIKENLNDQLEKAEKENEDANKELDEFYSEENLNQMSKDAMENGWFKDIHGNIIMLKDAMIDYIKTTADGLSVIGQKIQDEIILKLAQIQIFVRNGLNLGGTSNIDTPVNNPIVMNPVGGGIGGNGNIDIGKLIGGSIGNIQPIFNNPVMPMPVMNMPMNNNQGKEIKIYVDSINRVDGNVYDKDDIMKMMEDGGIKSTEAFENYLISDGKM